MSEREVPRCPRWAKLVLLAVLVFDVWLRGHTFGPTLRYRYGLDLWPVTGASSEPLDCDEAVYTYVGRRIVHGAALYRDLSDTKPPLGYWLYALAVAIGGPNELTSRLVPIPMVFATIALVWWLGLRIRGPGAACIAALTYAVASTDPYLFGNGANFEHAINLFATASLALVIAAWDKPGRSRLAAAGACVGAACLVKQVGIVHGVLYALALLLRRRRLQERLVDLFALAGGVVAVWSVAIAVMVAQGAGASAYDDIVTYGSALASKAPAEPNSPPRWERWVTGNADPRGRLPWPFGPTHYLVWWGTGTWPLWLAALPSLLALGLRHSTTPERRLVAAWTLSAWVQVALPGLFWQHYYLLPLPGLVVAVAAFLGDAVAASARPGIRRYFWAAVALLLSLALSWVARIQVRDYLYVSPEQLTVRYKGGGQWVVLRELGKELGRRSKVWVSPHLYVWGIQSPLFVYSGLDGVSRYLFADNLIRAYAGRDDPLIRPRTDRIMSDLRTKRPQLIFAGYTPFPALRDFLLDGYLPSNLVRASPDGRGLWVERGMYRAFETLR